MTQPSDGPPGRRWSGKWSWVALAGVVAVVLAIALSGGGGRRSPDARVQHIASEVRCPQCSGQSAADSDAETAVAIRDTIRQQVGAGRSDAQIKQYLVDRYGQDILERPPSTGVASLVWVLPVVAFVLALAGLAVAFRRWSTRLARGHADDADRALVEGARRDGGDGTSGG